MSILVSVNPVSATKLVSSISMRLQTWAFSYFDLYRLQFVGRLDLGRLNHSVATLTPLNFLVNSPACISSCHWRLKTCIYIYTYITPIYIYIYINGIYIPRFVVLLLMLYERLETVILHAVFSTSA